ncbi:transposable element Tcb2 transposase [Trichonephila clavipes]|nr:transposable element Tcb2 transposase [Trichonephila clavipes]
MKTRLRTSSTDQSSRKQSHRKKCTRTINCFIGRHPGTGSTLCLRFEWCRARGNCTAAEWNLERFVFSVESRFNLSSDDYRVREWKTRGERLNPGLALQRHITPTAGGMV